MIASYRDPECKYTIRDLFAKAAHPGRIRVGLVWQYAEEDYETPYFIGPFNDQIKVVKYPHINSQGACWARSIAQTLYDSEDYYLALDAHMRFVSGWDERLIEIHERLRGQGFQKPVISYYPPGYALPDETVDHRLNKVTPRPMIVKGERTGIVVNSRSVEIKEREPFLQAAASANFLFAAGSVVQDVPYDPHLYFYGEEISLAARLWTSGYDLFHPGCILAFHLYRRQRDPESGTRVYRRIGRHQVDHASSQREAFSYQRVRHLLGADISHAPFITKELEKFGLGNVRSLHQFSKYSGIYFRNVTVSAFGRLGVHAAEAIPLGKEAEIRALERAEAILSERGQVGDVSYVVDLLREMGVSRILDLSCSWVQWLQPPHRLGLQQYNGVSINRLRAHSLAVYLEGEDKGSVRCCNYAADPLDYCELVYDGGLLGLLPPRVVWQILISVKRSGAAHLMVLEAEPDLEVSWLCCSPYYLPEPVIRRSFDQKHCLVVWDVRDPRFQVESLAENTSQARRVLVQILFESLEIVRKSLSCHGDLFERLLAASIDMPRRQAETIFRSLDVLEVVSHCGEAVQQALELWWAIRRTNIRNVRALAGPGKINKELVVGYVEMQAIAWAFLSDYQHTYFNK